MSFIILWNFNKVPAIVLEAFLPSIIKIFQRAFDLESWQEINGLSLSNITKGDNVKSKKGRVVILVCDMSSCPVLHFCQVPSKYSKGYSSYRADEKYISNKTKEITPKVRKPELSFLYVTHHLVLFYISTNYHKNIPKGIQLTERTQYQWIITVKYNKRDIMPKVRKEELSFLYKTCCLVLFYISTKYHKNIPNGLWLTERTQNQCIITVRHNKGRQCQK